MKQPTLEHGSYREKLFDRRWNTKRNEILDRDHHCCVICGKNNHLVVHHKQYHYVKKLNVFRDPWEYNSKYLITLCESCHRRGHYLYKVPVKEV